MTDGKMTGWTGSGRGTNPLATGDWAWREGLAVVSGDKEHDLHPEELDVRLNGFGWEDRWDNFAGLQAKAFHLLKDLDLGRSGSALRQAGQIIFQEFGGSPGNSYTWVEQKDDLTLSLLSARLIELNLPINVAVGTRD